MNGPVPTRVSGADKAELIRLVNQAINSGWTATRACNVIGLDRVRWWRWTQRQHKGLLEDARPGGNPIHSILEGSPVRDS